MIGKSTSKGLYKVFADRKTKLLQYIKRILFFVQRHELNESLDKISCFEPSVAYNNIKGA